MRNFHFLLIAFFMSLISFETAYAQYRPGRHQAPASYSCTYTETGWEEHWSGHSSCGACLQKHGECRETCSESMDVCTVQGTTNQGYIRIFSASGPNRYRAESEAYRACQWDRNMIECKPLNCSTQSRVVSRRACR